MGNMKTSIITNIDTIIKGRVWNYSFEVRLEHEPAMYLHSVELHPDNMGFKVEVMPLNAAGYHAFETHISKSQTWINGPEKENELPYDIWDLMAKGDPKKTKESDKT